MEIKLKHSNSKWVEFPESKAKFKIGYLTLEQKDTLDDIRFQAAMTGEILSKSVDELSNKQKTKVLELNRQYYRLYLKYTIKDWRGIKDVDTGKDIKCKLDINEEALEAGTELYTPYWIGLCKNLTLNDLILHWKRIDKEIQFNNTDKKK